MGIYKVVNPVTDETLAEYPTITDTELRAAVDRADAAHGPWAAKSVAERATIVRRVGELYTERRQKLAEIIVREVGKPIDEALGEVDITVDIYDYYADNAESLLAAEPLDVAVAGRTAFVRRNSLGVILGIMPWNYPYYQVARFAAPNMIAGNTMLLKHARQCPESALAMEKIFHDAGMPRDAYINVFATAEQLQEVIADPRVHGVSLTGSEAAGMAVAEAAGRHLKKVLLELGGSDPFIVLSTDDLAGTVQSAVEARLGNAGQACNAPKRFIIADELYDPFVAGMAEAFAAIKGGDPMRPGTVLGPVSSTAAANGLEEQLQRAVAQGATVVVGGKRDGNYFEPTILADITPENQVFHEELFGPVACVYRVKSEDEAIQLANDTPFGLGSYIITTDDDQALRVANSIEAGMAFINAVGAEGAELPFGGIKRSGFGRELGRLGADEFVNRKMVLKG